MGPVCRASLSVACPAASPVCRQAARRRSARGRRPRNCAAASGRYRRTAARTGCDRARRPCCRPPARRRRTAKQRCCGRPPLRRALATPRRPRRRHPPSGRRRTPSLVDRGGRSARPSARRARCGDRGGSSRRSPCGSVARTACRRRRGGEEAAPRGPTTVWCARPGRRAGTTAPDSGVDGDGRRPRCGTSAQPATRSTPVGGRYRRRARCSARCRRRVRADIRPAGPGAWPRPRG
jgi:hypothetical protein